MKEKIQEYALITIGFIIIAIGVQYFYVPNNIAGGGVTGIAMVINHFIPSLGIGIIMLVMNILLFIIAFIVLGSGFGAKTIYASFGLTLTMTFIEKNLNPKALTNDVMLSTIVGTLLLGLGLGIVFSQNASTGGTDVIAKILNKFFKINMGKSMQMVDALVIVMIGITFGISNGLYAIVCVLLNGIIIDKVIEGFSSVKQVMIITCEVPIVKEYITKEIKRGCTILRGEGGYTGLDTNVVYCVMDRTQLVKLRRFIKKLDSNAFIVVNGAHEVLGAGFNEMV